MRRTKTTNNRGTQLMSLPVHVHIGSYRLNWYVVRDRGTTLFAGTWSQSRLENLHLGDGWELVRKYLSVVPEDEHAVLEFLLSSGRFNPPGGSIKSRGVDKTELRAAVSPSAHEKATNAPIYMVLESFSLQDFATIQDYVRRMLSSGNPTLPTPWHPTSYQRYEILFAGGRSGPQAHVSVSDTFPSILATVQFKLAQGALFRTCARRDCRLPFEVTSRHARRFCTQYCAHITSLRQRRRVERKTKKEKASERA
jgi:hypothetical protein